jgi:nucleoid-associated protein YgaU
VQLETLNMTNDVKLGLVIGVGLVIAVAVIFFRKDSNAAAVPDGAAAIPPGSAPPAPAPPQPSHAARFRPVSEPEQAIAATPAVRRHTVREGETLFTLAQRYYGDGDRFADLYRANRAVLKTPDALQPGIELVIPDLTGQQEASTPE